MFSLCFLFSKEKRTSMRSNSRSTITICIVLSIVTILCLITTSKAQKSKPSFIRFLRRYHKPKYQEEQQVRCKIFRYI